MKRTTTTTDRVRAAQDAVNAHAASRGIPRTAKVSRKIDQLLLDLRFLCRSNRLNFANAVLRTDAAYLDDLFPNHSLKRLYPPQNGDEA